MIDVTANRYADALFQLSEEENITEKIYSELHDVVDIVKNNKDLENVLKSPLISKIEKVELIEQLFSNKINNHLKNFLKILVEKGRINSLKTIELTFRQLLNDKNNIIEGTVVSAIPMSDEKIKQLESNLSKKYNKNVTLENKVDKTILGGVLVRLGNTQIDGTVKTRLDNIKDQLSQVIS